jgi:Carboxypeptidase regulatory-like domain
MKLRLLIIFVAMAVAAWSSTRAQTGPTGPPVYGTVSSKTRGPLSGVSVSLVNPTLGRNPPAFTDAKGYYFFTNVPPRQTYYIEAYWGSKLLYREKLDYQSGSVSHNISLP